MLVWGVKVRSTINPGVYCTSTDLTYWIHQLLVQLVSCVWQEVTFQMRAEWRSVLTMCGAQCVMTPGKELMLQWCVNNSDFLLKVYIKKHGCH